VKRISAILLVSLCLVSSLASVLAQEVLLGTTADSAFVDASANTLPEPGTYALFGAGFVLLGAWMFYRRRRWGQRL